MNPESSPMPVKPAVPKGCDPGQWNLACDLHVNDVLKHDGWGLPECSILPGEGAYSDLPKGLSTEVYYYLLKLDEAEKRAKGWKDKHMTSLILYGNVVSRLRKEFSIIYRDDPSDPEGFTLTQDHRVCD